MTLAARFFLVFIAAALALPISAQVTELRIRVPRPVGVTADVQLEKADLLLAWWGHTAEVPLAHHYEDGNLVVTVPLDQQNWNDTGRTDAPDFGFVRLVFADFVPVRSERFYLLGSKQPVPAPENWRETSEIHFAFRGVESVSMRRGEQRDVSLAVRRAMPRQLRFVDDAGLPVTDVTVSGGSFWSQNNHCGSPTGLDPMFADVRPDANGVVPLPDGDIEYGINVNLGDDKSIVEPDADSLGFFTTVVDTPEQIVRVHRHVRKPLTVRVTRAGKPAAGVYVGGGMDVACGAGYGPIGTTDAAGELHVPDFNPERIAAICIGAGERPFFTIATPESGEVSVDLPEDEAADTIRSCNVPH